MPQVMDRSYLPGVDAGTASETAGFRHALGHREFRWLALHHLVAGSGQSFGTVAVATALYQQTGSAAWVGAAAACRLVPYLLCAGPAGVLADRIDRRRLLLWSAVLRAAVTAVLVVGVAVQAAPRSSSSPSCSWARPWGRGASPPCSP